jgi:hypothetical protein
MTIEQLRRAHQARPFKPFTLFLTDGRTMEVRYPEVLAVFPAGRSIILTQPDDSYDVIDLLLVTSLHIGDGHPESGTKTMF